MRVRRCWRKSRWPWARSPWNWSAEDADRVFFAAAAHQERHRRLFRRAARILCSASAKVDTFTEKPGHFDASRYDIAVYQLGNNPHHNFAYEIALEHPGVVVLHEANLHHLIADLTIRRGDWDAYLREVEARRRRAKPSSMRAITSGPSSVAPDYDIPMLRAVLGRSRAAIVHSAAVESELRAQRLHRTGR